MIIAQFESNIVELAEITARICKCTFKKWKYVYIPSAFDVFYILSKAKACFQVTGLISPNERIPYVPQYRAMNILNGLKTWGWWI